MMKRTPLGLLTPVAMLCSTISLAQLKHVDHGAAAIERDELKCVNVKGEPVPCQESFANIKASDFSDHNDRALPTGHFGVGPSTKTATRAGTNGSPSGIAKTSEHYATVYSAHHGEVRRGEELPVRHVSTVAAPELDPTFATSTLALLAGCVAILRARRRKVARQ